MDVFRVNPQKTETIIDVVHDIGNTDYVLNGTVYKNAPQKSVLVGSESDLELLVGYEPGTFAYTAGYTNLWQLDVDGSWVAIE